MRICRSITSKCYALLWSYGEICVGCGCCSPNKETRRKGRLAYWKWRRHELLHFDYWATGYPDLIALQRKNIAHDLKLARRMIKVYSAARRRGRGGIETPEAY